MLGKFIKFNSSGANYGSALASGVDTTNIKHIENSAKGLIKANSKLKVKNNPDSLLKAATIAQKMEDMNDVMAGVSEQQLRTMQAGIKRLQIAKQHRKSAMNIETAWQREQQELTSDLLKFRMQTGIIQAESLGTQQAYSSSPLDAL